MSALLETHDLSIGYETPRRPQVRLARGINAALSAGELVCLIGPNGAGKTTLLRTLAGLHPPLAGTVQVGGQALLRLPAAARARRIGVVLTERALPGLMTGVDLVSLGRHPYSDWMGRLSTEDEAVVRWAVAAVDAEAFATQPLTELSDGQRQKLWIARALAQEPQVILLDEPTAYLDLPRRVEIMRLLHTLAQTTGRAILLSTHDLDLALRSADRVWLLADGQLHMGAPEDLVLNGAFEAAFHSEGVAFDVATGAFEVRTRGQQPVALMGEGTLYAWTQRALARAGYVVAADGAGVCVDVREAEDGPRWRAWHDGTSFECGSIGALLAHISGVTELPIAQRSP